MRTGHYTRLKGRTTYFRRKIPDFLQEQLASTEICYRLGVISSSVAERLGRRLAVEVDTFFDQAKTNAMLTSDDLTKLVQAALSGWREDDASEAAREIQAYGRPLLDPREKAEAWAKFAKGVIETVSEGDSVYTPDYVSTIAELAGVDLGSEPTTFDVGGRALSLGLAAHYLQSAVVTASLNGLAMGSRRLPVEDWQTRLFALEAHLGLDRAAQTQPRDRQGQPQPAADKIPTPPELQPPANETALDVVHGQEEPDLSQTLFSQVVAISLATRIAGKKIKPDMESEIRPSVRIWTEVLGDRAIGSYRRADMLEYLSVLQQVPKIYWKSQASRQLSILEVVARARADAREAFLKTSTTKNASEVLLERASADYAKLNHVTINRHLSAICPVFEWAYDNHYLPEDTRIFWNNLQLQTGSPYSGLKANEERPAFSAQQILTIFNHPIWLGRESEYFYNKPGDVIIRDSLYWGPIIALLHGMRLEEFAQLRVQHVRMIEGIWVFDLYAKGLDLKNVPSKRYVPLHSWLLKLGFIEAMIDGRSPQEQLFPELGKNGKIAHFGDALGKRFTRVLDNLEIVVIRKNGTESDGAFHPLRHRFITDLQRGGVNVGIVDYLSGHASTARESVERKPTDERVRYTEDPFIIELKEAIEKLPVSVDFESLVAAWQRCGSVGRGKSKN